MDEDTGPSRPSRDALMGLTGHAEVGVEARRTLREGFLEMATVLALHNSVRPGRLPSVSGPVRLEPSGHRSSPDL